MDRLLFKNPVISRRTSGLFSLFDDDEKLHCGRLCSEVCVDVCFHSRGFVHRSGVAGSEGNSAHRGPAAGPPRQQRPRVGFPRGLASAGTAWLLDRSHPGGCEVIPH